MRKRCSWARKQQQQQRGANHCWWSSAVCCSSCLLGSRRRDDRNTLRSRIRLIPPASSARRAVGARCNATCPLSGLASSQATGRRRRQLLQSNNPSWLCSAPCLAAAPTPRPAAYTPLDGVGYIHVSQEQAFILCSVSGEGSHLLKTLPREGPAAVRCAETPGRRHPSGAVAPVTCESLICRVVCGYSACKSSTFSCRF